MENRKNSVVVDCGQSIFINSVYGVQFIFKFKFCKNSIDNNATNNFTQTEIDVIF